MSYLTDNKYKMLFIVAVVSYGIYDHYHENYIGNAAGAIKNGLFSFWQKATCPSTKQAGDNNNNQEKDVDFQFVGPGSY